MTSTATVINRTLNKNARRVLKHIAESYGATSLGVAHQVLGLSFETLRRHVDALGEAGLVEVCCNGARVPEGVETTDVWQSGGVVYWTQRKVPGTAWVRAEEDRTGMPAYNLRVTVEGRAAL